MGFIINELITCILVTKHMKSNVSIPALLSNVMQSNKQKNILEDQVTVLKKKLTNSCTSERHFIF